MTEQHRRSSDAGEPTNAELLNRIALVSAQIDSWINEHRHDHMTLERRLATHDTASALRDHNIERLIGEVDHIAPEIRTLHDFQTKVETISSMLRWTFGGSLIAALAALASLVISLSHLAGP